MLLVTPLCLIPDSLRIFALLSGQADVKRKWFMVVCQQTRPKVKVLLLNLSFKKFLKRSKAHTVHQSKKQKNMPLFPLELFLHPILF